MESLFCCLLGSGSHKSVLPVGQVSKSENGSDPEMQYRLGLEFKDSTATEQSNRKAFLHFKAAADSNYAHAQFELGIMYDRGIGCEKNSVAAIECFGKAAEEGHVVAKCYTALANMQKTVDIFKKNEPNDWITFSSSLLLRGWDVVPDYFEEMATYEFEIAPLGIKCAQAKFIYAWLERCMTEKSMKNTKYIDFFLTRMKDCASQGYAPAQYQLGLLLHEKGQDPTEVIKQLEQAAFQNYAPAQYLLSVILKTIPGHQKESAHYLIQAANQEYPQAQNAIRIENNLCFRIFASRNELYDGRKDGKTVLPFLPPEIVANIISFNWPDPIPAPSTWFDNMVELVHWDWHGFKPDALHST